MTVLELRQVFKRYPHSQAWAVEDLSFTLDAGEILALVGPSGCGKTTTLRLAAGLERPERGEIWIDGRTAASGSVFMPPERRGLGMVFQEHALFPHLTVYENVAFGLHERWRPERDRLVQEMLSLMGLAGYARRYPHALSGGERQRVALARALAPRPVLALFDEPFSSLDADLRLEMRRLVRSLLKQLGATALFVTHDQEEALTMGDRLAVMHQGRLEQVGSPEQVFQSPASRFTAEFMGGSSFIRGEVAEGGILTELGLLEQPVGLPPLTPVEVAVRADDIGFIPDAAGNGVIVDRVFRGVMNVYHLRLDSGLVLQAFKEHTLVLPVGQRVRAAVDAGHPLCVFPVYS